MAGATSLEPDGTVRFSVFGRDIWYDIERHQVLRWQEKVRDELLIADMAHSGAPQPSESTACKDCACASAGTDSGPNETAREERRESAPGGGVEDAITTIELHLNDKCNFRCTYCYLSEAGIEYHDNEMSEDVAFKAVDFLIQQIPDARTPGMIKFYGGEPLLSYGLLQKVVDYATRMAAGAGKEVYFSVNTNGSLLTEERIDWLVREKVQVTISIDGDAESHNRVRKYERGGDTYAAVLKKARNFVQRSGYARVRATVSDGAFSAARSMPELHDSLAESRTPVNVAVMTEGSYVGGRRISDEDVDRINEDHSRLALLWLERLKEGKPLKYGNFLAPMFSIMKSLRSSHKCGAARTLVGVSPAGKMYPCHRFIDVEDVAMGTVETGLNEEIRRQFEDNRVELKDPCRTCAVRYFCGGGCAHNNFFSSGNIRDGNEAYCRVFRHQTKLGLYLYTELTREQAAIRRIPVDAEPSMTGMAGTPESS